MGWLQKLSEGLSKTRTTVTGQLDRWLGRTPDPALIEDLENALISSDIGVHVVQKFVDRVKNEVRGAEAATDNGVKSALRRTVLDVLWPVQAQSITELIEKGPKPFVILIVGVNGVGKTTTVAKLAHGIYRADTVEWRHARSEVPDETKTKIPTSPNPKLPAS